MKISSGEPVGEVADRMKLLLGEGYTVKDRIAQQEESFRMISVEKWVTFCMLAFILVIASFNGIYIVYVGY